MTVLASSSWLPTSRFRAATLCSHGCSRSGVAVIGEVADANAAAPDLVFVCRPDPA